MLAGDFTAFASPVLQRGPADHAEAPFVNNRINPALFSKPAVKFAANCRRRRSVRQSDIWESEATNDHAVVRRIDYQLNTNHSIFGRYLLESLVTPASFDLNHNLLSIGTANDALAQAFTIGDTYLFGANIVNAFRLTANRIAGGKFDRSQ